MPNAKNNALALLGCLGWLALVGLAFLIGTGALVGVARNPPVLISIFWGLVAAIVVAGVVFYRTTQEGKTP